MKYPVPILVIFLFYQSALGIDDGVSDMSDDDQLSRVRRGGLSMLRLGRGLQMLRLGKRGIPMLRLGRSAGRPTIPDDLRYFLSVLRDDRQVPLPRYGKSLPFQFWLENAIKNGDIVDLLEGSPPTYGYYDLDDNTERQVRPAPRPGMRRLRRSVDSEDRGVRAPPYPRYGKDLEDEEKQLAADEKLQLVRQAPLMRYGKEDTYDANGVDEDFDQETVKRAMRMLRLGRGMRMLRLGKRPVAMDDQDDEIDNDKRALRLLRLGKRPFKMLRLGRAQEPEIDDEKRALKLLRLGKRSDGDDEESS